MRTDRPTNQVAYEALLRARGTANTAAAIAQPDWFVDPSNVTGLASNTNNGATAITPLLTWDEIARRYGTIFPIIDHDVVWQGLSDPPNLFDPANMFVMRPILVDAGTCTIFGGFVSAGPGGNLAGVVAKNRATGTPLSSALVTTPGTFIQNGGSRAIADAAGVISQPFQSITTTPPTRPFNIFVPPPEDDSWADGQAFTLLRPIQVNVVDFQPTNAGGDVAGDVTFAFMQQIWIPDPVAIGFSYVSLSANIQISECRIDRFASIFPYKGAIGDAFNTAMLGVTNSEGIDYLGGIASGAFAGCELDGDIILHGIIMAPPGTPNTVTFLGFVFTDGSMIANFNSAFSVTTLNYGGSSVYGPGALEAAGAGEILFDTSAVAQLQVLGGLRLDATSVGSNYTPATGLFVGNVALTQANIDAAPGRSLFNPQTGSRFSLSAS